MVKFLDEDEIEKVRNEERRQYFEYMNQLRKHEKNMKKAFTITIIMCVLIVSGILLYGHYNNQTLILVIKSPSEETIEAAAKQIIVKDFNKLKFDSNGELKITLDELYNNKYNVKIDKLFIDESLCEGYLLITKTDKYYQIDTTHYCDAKGE